MGTTSNLERRLRKRPLPKADAPEAPTNSVEDIHPGGKSLYLPAWLIRSPYWDLTDDRSVALTDEQVLVLVGLFKKCRRTKNNPHDTVSLSKSKDLCALIGMAQPHVNDAINGLIAHGVIIRRGRSRYDLAPAIGESISSKGVYLYRKIPLAVVELVAKRVAPRKRAMAIPEFRLWMRIFDAWVQARTACPRINMAKLCTALGTYEEETVRRTYKRAIKKGFIVRAAPERGRSAIWDPRPIKSVLVASQGAETPAQVEAPAAPSSLRDQMIALGVLPEVVDNVLTKQPPGSAEPEEDKLA